MRRIPIEFSLRVRGELMPDQVAAILEGQLDDVKNSRRELQRVIKAVDKEIVTVFETAFNDVQENFTNLFTTLFPGGSGRHTGLVPFVMAMTERDEGT